MRVGDWSKVVSDGIRRLELILRSSSWSTSRILVVLLRFLWGGGSGAGDCIYPQNSLADGSIEEVVDVCLK